MNPDAPIGKKQYITETDNLSCMSELFTQLILTGGWIKVGLLVLLSDALIY